MNATSWIVLCLAYIVGLLSTAILGFPTDPQNWQGWGTLCLGLGVAGIVAGAIVPRGWRTGPRLPLWAVAGLVGAIAVAYLQFRTLQPEPSDISHLAGEVEGLVQVRGRILEMPSVNRSQRVRFVLAAAEAGDRQAVTGKLYVTVPLLQGTGLYPKQEVKLQGFLYLPQAAENPGAFDFQAYLARRGIFAGFSGELVEEPTEAPWGWWKLRQRIIRAQVRWLGSPAGPLVSSMVLGRRAVDLPHDIRAQFIRAGLAHILAASGFHVSLLLGLVLALTRNLSGKTRLGVGLTVLVVYVGLTGVQPSVMRAAIMGGGALFALAAERRVKPLGLLLLTATGLLLFNPLWIWDLGFQLSFLATLGLIVTMPLLVQRLDWLPPAIATLIAVPLAASIWTLPLLCSAFNVVATYSIATNIIATPLISIVSLGGMVSAAAALIFPPAGSAIALLLYYPAQALILLVNFCNALPGSSWAVGRITAAQLAIVYGAIALVWLSRKAQRLWGAVALCALTVVLLPIAYRHFTTVQVTVLATRQEPAVVLQDRGKVALMGCIEPDTASYTVLPFLAQEGINQLNLAIAFNSKNCQQDGWNEIFANLPVRTFLAASETLEALSQKAKIAKSLPLKAGQAVKLNSTQLKILSLSPPTIRWQSSQLGWLLADFTETATLPPLPAEISPEVLVWSGGQLPAEGLNWPLRAAIATSPKISAQTLSQLRQKQVRVYTTQQEGAIQWTRDKGFQTTQAIAE